MQIQQRIAWALATVSFIGLAASDALAEAPACGFLDSEKQILLCCRSTDDTQKGQFACYEKAIQYAFGEFVKEWKAYQEISREENTRFAEKIAEQWDEPEVTTTSTWVEYSEDFRERQSVDFENKTITFELVGSEGTVADRDALREKLTALITKTAAEAFRDDVVSQAIETRSKAELEHVQTAEVPEVPILLSYLMGFSGRVQAAAEYAGEIVEHMLAKIETTSVTNRNGTSVQRIEVPLEAPTSVIAAARSAHGISDSPSALPASAAAFWGYVQRYASEWEVDTSLVYAVMETESNFLPRAKSHVPAYGLMQIVPGSAGKDVTKRLFNEERILAPSYLYVPENNIQAGSTYLNILDGYFKGIHDPVSRLYCKIAGYNAGPGTVARVVSGEKTLRALAREANKLKPQQVLERLMKGLPEETRRYLEKVDRLKAKYEAYGV